MVLEDLRKDINKLHSSIYILEKDIDTLRHNKSLYETKIQKIQLELKTLIEENDNGYNNDNAVINKSYELDDITRKLSSVNLHLLSNIEQHKIVLEQISALLKKIKNKDISAEILRYDSVINVNTEDDFMADKEF